MRPNYAKMECLLFRYHRLSIQENKFMYHLRKLLFVISAVLAMSLVFGTPDSVFADSSDIRVSINGTTIEFPDAKPYLSDNRTFVPVRFVSEQLGASVAWDDENGTGPGTVEINKDRDNIKLSIGSVKLIKNGVASSMDVAPVITGSRTMVPLRFVSEQLGAVVKWDAENNTVLITTGSEGSSYTVKQGDTLWGIASAHGTSIGELLSINPGLNPDRLTVGQELRLLSSSGTEPDASDTPSKNETATKSAISRGNRGARGEVKDLSLTGSGDEIAAFAKEFIGTPYVYGGASPDGFDCSGFTQYIAAHFGGNLPHSSSDQYEYGVSVEREDLQPGDFIFFQSPNDPMTIGHVGIYVGEGQFIHAPQAGDTVKITNLSNIYFDPRYYGAVRLTTEEER